MTLTCDADGHKVTHKHNTKKPKFITSVFTLKPILTRKRFLPGNQITNICILDKFLTK